MDVKNDVNALNLLNSTVIKMTKVVENSTKKSVDEMKIFKKDYESCNEVREYEIEFSEALGKKMKFIQKNFAEIGYTFEDSLDLAIHNGINKFHSEATSITMFENFMEENVYKHDEKLRIFVKYKAKIHDYTERDERENDDEIIFIKREKAESADEVRSFSIKLAGELRERIKNNAVISNEKFGISRNLGLERSLEMGINDIFEGLQHFHTANKFLEIVGVYI